MSTAQFRNNLGTDFYIFHDDKQHIGIDSLYLVVFLLDRSVVSFFRKI